MAYPFLQARWYRPTTGRNIDVIVVHSMEYPEKPTAAEDIARYFARTDTKASAHYCCDNNSTVQCVHDRDVAFHAPGANRNGIGIEHAGYARQATAEWLDTFSLPMLRDQSAPLTALLCREYSIPVVWLNVDDLRSGARGITSHHNVSLAFGQSTHTDPGPGFPISLYLDMVREHLPHPTPPPSTPPSTPFDPMEVPDVYTVIVAGRYFIVANGCYWEAIPNENVPYESAKVPQLRFDNPGLWDKHVKNARLAFQP